MVSLNELKRTALDEVMREYSLVLRVAEFRADARSIVLLAICRLIDLLKEKKLDDDEPPPTIDLSMLQRIDKNYFSDANWPCTDPFLDEPSRLELMRKLFFDAPFWPIA